MRGTWFPNAEEHPPSPPSKGGKERKRRGDVIPSKGECGAVSHQQTACGMPCRGEPCVRPFFVWCRVIRTQISQMGANQRK